MVPRTALEEDRLLEIALEAGAEDLVVDEESYLVTTPHDQLYQVGEAIRQAGIPIELQKLSFIPENLVPVQDSSLADQVLRLCDELEENEDVQSVHGNFDIAEETLAKLAH